MQMCGLGRESETEKETGETERREKARRWGSLGVSGKGAAEL